MRRTPHILSRQLRVHRMIAYQRAHLPHRIVVKLQPPHDPLRDQRTVGGMSVKMILSILIGRKYIRLAHIMEQHHEPEHLVRRDTAHRHKRMLTRRICMVRIVLPLYHDPVKLRHDHRCDPGLIRQPEPMRQRGRHKLHQLRLNPLRTDLIQLLCHIPDRIPHVICQGKSELSCEPHRPQHPQSILSEALLRVANAPDYLIFQILHPAELIHEPGLRRIRHRIDRKIPALQILCQIRGKCHALRMTAILICAINPVRRHLKALFSIHDRHRAMLNARVDRPWKQRLYLLRRRRCRNIPVPRCAPQNGIPHTASDHIGLIPGPLQRL